MNDSVVTSEAVSERKLICRWNYYIVYPILQNNETQLVGVPNTFFEI